LSDVDDIGSHSAMTLTVTVSAFPATVTRALPRAVDNAAMMGSVKRLRIPAVNRGLLPRSAKETGTPRRSAVSMHARSSCSSGSATVDPSANSRRILAASTAHDRRTGSAEGSRSPEASPRNSGTVVSPSSA